MGDVRLAHLLGLYVFCVFPFSLGTVEGGERFELLDMSKSGALTERGRLPNIESRSGSQSARGSARSSIRALDLISPRCARTGLT